MSFLDCIRNGEREGRIRAPLAAELRAAYEGAMRAHDLFGPDADQIAARSVFGDFTQRVSHRRRKVIQQMQAQDGLEKHIRGYRDERGRANPAEALKSVMDSQGRRGRPGAWQRYEALRQLFHAHLNELFPKFERDLLGNTRNQGLLGHLVDELFGTDTGNPAARALAQAWRETSDLARRMYNAAGGAIAKLPDWGLPQAHDWLAISRAGAEEWKAFIKPLLDRTRMVDGLTGRPFTDDELDDVLGNIYDTLSTEGWANREVTSRSSGRSHANRRADHRFLHFTDAAAWRAYQERFGEADAFAAMMGYIDGMSRDIALMQRLGPNPAAGLRYAFNLLENDAALTADPKMKGRVEPARNVTQTMYDLMTGEANRPVHANAARVMGNVRQVLVSAQLGGAMLSAVSDVGFGAITAKFNGLKATRVMANQIKLLNPGNAADRQLALQLGLMADEAAHVMSSQQRYLGEVWGGKLAQKLSDGVLRASGLSPWTQAGRWAFGMEFSAMLAREAGKEWDALPGALRKQFEGYGFSRPDWDDIRSTNAYQHQGAAYLRADDVRTRTDLEDGRGEELALRLLAMIRTETNYAVPTTSLYGRAAFFGGLRPGTVPGELLKSTAMYKGFAITLVMTHMRRALTQTTWKGKLGYALPLIATTGVLGALSLQLKEIAKGRDPRPMNGEHAAKFWMAALYQGGGLGIFGDFIFSDANRFGSGLGETLAGPVVGAVNDLRKLTQGNIQQILEGDSLEETKAGRELVDFLARYHPGASLWYTRLAEERMLIDTLRDLTDPENSQRNARVERRYQREFGQSFWWAPGDRIPERAPDLSEALNGDAAYN